MARQVRKSGMKEVPLSEVKDDLSRYLREAEQGPVVITRHGKAAGVLIGFESEDDWFDFRLENDPRFLERIEKARARSRRPAPACAQVPAPNSRTSVPTGRLVPGSAGIGVLRGPHHLGRLSLQVTVVSATGIIETRSAA